MAIDFVHYRDTDLVIHTWTQNFSLKEFLQATRAYLLSPARYEILDIRRLNHDSIGSMDLFSLAEHLHTAYRAERHVPGKTAVVYHDEMPPPYGSSQRLFHNFSIWAKEHRLPRDFALFSSMAEAVSWLGDRRIRNAHGDELLYDLAADATAQPLSA